MAPTIFIPGVIGVSVKAPGDSQFSLLGFCRDGVQVRENVRMRPIHGDEGGGPDGIPVDFSYLGEYHDVRLELYKYDGQVLAKIAARLATTAKAREKVYEPGWLVRAAGGGVRAGRRFGIRGGGRLGRLLPAANRGGSVSGRGRVRRAAVGHGRHPAKRGTLCGPTICGRDGRLHSGVSRVGCRAGSCRRGGAGRG